MSVNAPVHRARAVYNVSVLLKCNVQRKWTWRWTLCIFLTALTPWTSPCTSNVHYQSTKTLCTCSVCATFTDRGTVEMKRTLQLHSDDYSRFHVPYTWTQTCAVHVKCTLCVHKIWHCACGVYTVTALMLFTVSAPMCALTLYNRLSLPMHFVYDSYSVMAYTGAGGARVK